MIHYQKPIYLTPTELIEKYPLLHENLGWTNKEIGMFLHNNLLIGKYHTGYRRSMISEQSFIELMYYANSIIEKQKMPLPEIK